MKRRYLPTFWGSAIIVLFIAVIGVAFVFLNTQPERINITSGDGVFAIFGDVPSEVEVRIDTDLKASTQAWTAVVGSVYVVSPDGVQLPELVNVRMDARGRSSERQYRIGWFDTNRGVWVPLETRRDPEREIFEAQTDHFSHWALLQLPNFRVLDSEKEALITEALEAIPPEAVSYRVDIAHATVEGDFVLEQEAVAVGVCDGNSSTKERTVRSSVEKNVELFLDENTSISGWLRALVMWDVGNGCNSLIER